MSIFSCLLFKKTMNSQFCPLSDFSRTALVNTATQQFCALSSYLTSLALSFPTHKVGATVPISSGGGYDLNWLIM